MASLLFSALSRRANNLNSLADCTPETCSIDSSYYYYRVSLAANVTFITLFGISFIAYIVTFALTRRALAFTLAFFAGVILEVIGYAGRIMSWENQWIETGFLMQIVCLTIAPAFMAGGIYICLRRIVYAFGPENSRIAPESYTRIFIPCDVVSLLLQAAGGGLASAESNADESPDTGDHIMVAGLAFQVLTLLLFMGLCTDFFIRTQRRYRSMGEAAFDQDPIYIALRRSTKFKGFLAALTLATICIFWRSVFRVAELSEGWSGHVIRQQNLFIGFEGVMVIVACAALNIFHPAICFKEGVTGLGGLGSSRKERKERKAREKEENQIREQGNGSLSDADAEAEAEAIRSKEQSAV